MSTFRQTVRLKGYFNSLQTSNISSSNSNKSVLTSYLCVSSFLPSLPSFPRPDLISENNTEKFELEAKTKRLRFSSNDLFPVGIILNSTVLVIAGRQSMRWLHTSLPSLSLTSLIHFKHFNKHILGVFWIFWRIIPQTGSAKPYKCSLPGVPPHRRGHRHLLRHHAHGDQLEGHHWGDLDGDDVEDLGFDDGDVQDLGFNDDDVQDLGFDDDDDVSVARWERGLQGFDDDPDRWIHPLLPHAHRTQCWQVDHQHNQPPSEI